MKKTIAELKRIAADKNCFDIIKKIIFMQLTGFWTLTTLEWREYIDRDNQSHNKVVLPKMMFFDKIYL